MFPRARKIKVVSSQHIKVKSVIGRTFSNASVQKWIKIQQLPALNQGNK